MAIITEHEAAQIDQANKSGKTPIVFVHGLWLLPSSWDRWTKVFEDAGFVTLAPGWPDDPYTVEEANRHSEVMAHKTVGQIADHFADVVKTLTKKPAIIGHSFGGLLTQILAGRGLSAADVAMDPAPFRGVLPLPISALRSSSPVLGNPLNHGRAVPLTYEQFRYAFANAVSEDEPKELYNPYAVPGSGVPLFQAASANLNPWTEVKVKTKNPDRGPRPLAHDRPRLARGRRHRAHVRAALRQALNPPRDNARGSVHLNDASLESGAHAAPDSRVRLSGSSCPRAAWRRASRCCGRGSRASSTSGSGRGSRSGWRR